MDVVARARSAVAGRLVVVTGASSGIGRASVQMLAPAGARLVVVARRESLLEQVAADARALGSEVATYAVDLRDTVAAAACARAVVSEHGIPDVVVANAGQSMSRGVLDYVDRFDAIERTAGVNYLGAVAFLLPFLRPMADRGSGHVVGVTTVNARVPLPGWSPYCASKAAFDVWLRCVGPELRGRGIATTIIEFPLVDTPMVRPVYGPRPPLAMSPERAARWVCRAVVDRPAQLSPWWARPAQVLTAAAPIASARLVGRFSMRRRPQGR
ncbi:MAG: SDR family NAD(P)-dependent oxidoreductase [Dermatophilaceae bacterium]